MKFNPRQFEGMGDYSPMVTTEGRSAKLQPTCTHSSHSVPCLTFLFACTHTLCFNEEGVHVCVTMEKRVSASVSALLLPASGFATVIMSGATPNAS